MLQMLDKGLLCFGRGLTPSALIRCQISGGGSGLISNAEPLRAALGSTVARTSPRGSGNSHSSTAPTLIALPRWRRHCPTLPAQPWSWRVASRLTY